MEKNKFSPKQSILTDSEDVCCFPKRKSYNTTGKKIELLANYFNFKFNDEKKNKFFKYSVVFLPDIPEDSFKLRSKIFNRAVKDNTDVMQFIGHYIFNNTTLYSLELCNEKIEVRATHLDQEYNIMVSIVNAIEPVSLEALGLYKRFFHQLLRKIKFIQIKRNYFEKDKAKAVQNFEVWPGFTANVNLLNNATLLNMNLVYRVIRPDTAFTEISKLSSGNRNFDLSQLLTEKFKGMVVLTRYNNRTYIIDNVDLNKTPLSTFKIREKNKNGEFVEREVSFVQYYKEKYNYSIKVTDQPLLVHHDKKKNDEIYLIPELCHLTGLTDEIRSNFNLMKEMALITKGTANEKMLECQNLINGFLNNKDCVELMKTWGLSILNKPLKIEGYRMPAGSIQMHKKQDGSRYSFNIDETPDIDRKIQSEMFSQPAINCWAIFYNQRDEQTAKTFLDTLQQVQSTFNYQLSKPEVFPIRSINFNDWKTEIKKCKQNTQAVVCIIPGQRGKGALYNDIKKLLLTEVPIPSQVVLAGTISKGKGVRSIVNKVLIQICAKLGGEPWALDKMPFNNCPTMVCGIDIFRGAGKKSIFGFTATYNRTFTKYVSIPKIMEDGKEDGVIGDCIKDSVNNFNDVNKIFPQHIIIIRDGVSPGQIKTVCLAEAKEIRNCLNKLNQTNCKVFSCEGGRIENTQPGTIVDAGVTSGDSNDFFLIPQKCTQGVASSIHYSIVYDDFKILESDFHLLMYRLCFLYYNWTGGIKVPAPCQYAHKLAYLLGEKLADKKSCPVPHARFNQQIKSLYYL